MSAASGPTAPSRQDRRRSRTRARILRAAEELFRTRGYAETSIEQIAESADVATRTIYLHFPSKAAMLLAAFDDWVDGFVAALAARPVTEPVAQSIESAALAMEDDGADAGPDRTDAGTDGTDAGPDGADAASAPAAPRGRVHPMVEALFDGPAEVAGHVLQRWMHAQRAFTAQGIAAGLAPAEARARALAAFSGWIAALAAAADDADTPAAGDVAADREAAFRVVRALTSGRL